MIGGNRETKEAAASRKPEREPAISALVELFRKLEILIVLGRVEEEGGQGEQCGHKQGRDAKNRHEDGAAAVELCGEQPDGAGQVAQGRVVPQKTE